MVAFSLISLLSAIMSVIAILIVFLIFTKVYQEEYKRPWLFIGISTLFLGSSQLLRFLSGSLGVYIINSTTTEAITYILDFIAVTILAYALLLEQMILIYIKGKFIKMKFIPVQEGSLDGDIDMNVSNGVSYLSVKRNRNEMFSQFSQATKKGFEGFLIVEENPKEIREKYQIFKTPIAWVSHIDSSIDSRYLKDSLDENSDIIDPLQLNNIINFIDNFLEQSQNPFVMIDLNMILRTNNYTIVIEFLKYVSSKIERYNGVFICLLNTDILKKDQIDELGMFLKNLE